MLTHPTLEKLKGLKLCGMARALEEQFGSEKTEELSFEERLGLLVDREMTEKENRRFASRLKKAKLRLSSAVLEDIDYKASRGLDRRLLHSLACCDWVRKKQNILVIGATGAGKTFLTCALGHQACREGFKTKYFRSPGLFQELGIARGDGRYMRVMDRLSKTDVLILDDWGIVGLTDSERTEVLDILEDRHGRRSTIIASQLPLDDWHQSIGNPTIADAIMDRLVHNAHTVILKDKDSMRKRRAGE